MCEALQALVVAPLRDCCPCAQLYYLALIHSCELASCDKRLTNWLLLLSRFASELSHILLCKMLAEGSPKIVITSPKDIQHDVVLYDLIEMLQKGRVRN